MKPTKTCHITRAILRNLGSTLETDHNGLYMTSPSFPDVHQSTDSFRSEWLAYNIARKRELDSPDTEQAARLAFVEAESKCETIERQGLPALRDHQHAKLLYRAAQIMQDLIGDRPPSDWFRYCEFTGGASTSRNRSESHPSLKWWASPQLEVTPLALKHLEAFRASCQVIDAAWSDPGILSATTYVPKAPLYWRLVPGSRLDFVEKNYRTKRTILIEPDGNMLLQKGVGGIFRKCLRAVGINLNSQKRNQRLAFAGSVSGSLGTIDIAAASDSVTLALLRVLLPWEWYKLIYELRSPVYRDGDEWKTMRKVSSMGNGFTFELESAVFYCLTKAVVDIQKPSETRVAVFGDDIIVASEVCASLSGFLVSCGFEVNTEKSFWEGPFRESCGKHYHAGADVTPVYIKPDLDLDQLYRLYNQLRSWAGGDHGFSPDPRFHPMLDAVLAAIPKKDRSQVPLEYSSTSGLYYADVCENLITRRHTSRGDFIRFVVYEQDLHYYPDDMLEDELRWLYAHMSGYGSSCPLGTEEYLKLSFSKDRVYGDGVRYPFRMLALIR